MFPLHDNKDRLYSKIFCYFLQKGLQYEAVLEQIISRQVPMEVLQRVTPELIVDYFDKCAFETSDNIGLFQQCANVTVKLQANTLLLEEVYFTFHVDAEFRIG